MSERDIKILVVDDEEDFLEPISYWLKTHGYQVMTAMTGEKMLELVEKEEFDAVFLDINMQPMDGFECLFEMKKRKPDLSIIMITAERSSIREGKARALGADGFFYKGAEYSDAARAIDKILSEKKSNNHPSE